MKNKEIATENVRKSTKKFFLLIQEVYKIIKENFDKNRRNFMDYFEKFCGHFQKTVFLNYSEIIPQFLQGTFIICKNCPGKLLTF